MLGDRLRAARKNASLTQEDLAKKIGVKRSVISKYENGTIDPTFSQLQRIADALQISLGKLIGLSDIEAFNASYDGYFDTGLAEITLKKYGIPQENIEKCIDELFDNISHSLLSGDMAILKQFIDRLNDDGKTAVINRVMELSEVPRYQRNYSPKK